MRATRRILRLSGWALLSLWLCLPLAADESPADLLKQLSDKDTTVRVKAVEKLRALGEKARGAIETFVVPGAATPAEPVPTEAQKAEVARLIVALDAADYKSREVATKALIKLGKPGTAQLREAAKSDKPEVASRAKRVLAQLYPPPPGKSEGEGARMEAAMVLGHIGNTASIPALRRVLFGEASSANLAEAAAYALREITGGGPATAALRWKTDRVKLLAEWKTHLAAAAPKGEPAELALRYTPGSELAVKENTRFGIEVDMSKTAAKIPGVGNGTIKMAGSITSEYTLGVSGAKPLVLTRKFSAHKQVMKMTGGPGAGQPDRERASWKGKTLTLSFADDAVTAKLDDDGAPGSGLNGPMALGHALALLLPSGRYAVGERKPMSPAQLLQLGSLLFHSAKGSTKKLLDVAGSVRYVGSKDGRDRYFVTFRGLRPEGKGAMACNLQGVMTIDPARGLMVGHELAGLMWQAVKGSGPMGDMVGEVRLGCSEGTAAKKQDPDKE